MTDLNNAVELAREWLASTDATDGHLAADVLAEALIALHAALPNHFELAALDLLLLGGVNERAHESAHEYIERLLVVMRGAL